MFNATSDEGFKSVMEWLDFTSPEHRLFRRLDVELPIKYKGNPGILINSPYWDATMTSPENARIKCRYAELTLPFV